MVVNSMGKMFQNGDILVFKAGEQWISKCIALLTNSDVSHAAMVYQDETMVEMGLSGIHLTPVTAMHGEGAYLMRLSSEPDSQPLTAAADRYLNARTRYDVPALVILGGLIIYRSIRPTPEFVVIADLILRAASRALDKLIQTVILHNKDKAMVCSQLVYQIYHDCGSEYQIHLEGGILQSGSETAKCLPQNGMIRLIEEIDKKSPIEAPRSAEWVENITGGGDPEALSEDDTEDNTEELSHRLYEVIKAQDDNLMVSDFSPLLKPAKKFLERLEQFLESIESDIPIDALFVTPADFVYHAKNLYQVTMLDIRKEQ